MGVVAGSRWRGGAPGLRSVFVYARWCACSTRQPPDSDGGGCFLGGGVGYVMGKSMTFRLIFGGAETRRPPPTKRPHRCGRPVPICFVFPASAKLPPGRRVGGQLSDCVSSNSASDYPQHKEEKDAMWLSKKVV